MTMREGEKGEQWGGRRRNWTRDFNSKCLFNVYRGALIISRYRIKIYKWMNNRLQMIVMRYGRRGWKKGVWVWTVGRAGGEWCVMNNVIWGYTRVRVWISIWENSADVCNNSPAISGAALPEITGNIRKRRDTYYMPTCSISLDGVAQQSSSIYSIEYQFKFLPGNLLRKLQVSLNSTFFSFFGGGTTAAITLILMRFLKKHLKCTFKK